MVTGNVRHMCYVSLWIHVHVLPYIYPKLQTQVHGITSYTGAISCETLSRGPPHRVGAMKLGSIKPNRDDMHTCGPNHPPKEKERKSSS